MTRLPTENHDVTGIEYSSGFPKYTVGPLCAAPGCSRFADHAHHIWRRSFLTGDFGWVKLWDDTIVQNLCGLCYKCHDLVTENKAEINFVRGAFVWSNGFLLSPQPRLWGSPEPVAPADVTEHLHGPGASEKCPTCQRALPRESPTKSDGPRHREKWTITVPVDERENGANVLDTLLDECAKIFGHDQTKALRYFTTVQALALVVQHGGRMIGDS